jgi:hypothetical protein
MAGRFFGQLLWLPKILMHRCGSVLILPQYGGAVFQFSGVTIPGPTQCFPIRSHWSPSVGWTAGHCSD